MTFFIVLTASKIVLFAGDLTGFLKDSLSPVNFLKLSLRIQPPLIRSRYYVRNAFRTCVSHVVAGANKSS